MIQVTVTDLCGREAPKTVDLSDAADALGLDRDDIEFIEDQIADRGVAFIGEFEYRPIG
jgi:hypothetical protein